MTEPVHTPPRGEAIARWILVISVLVLIVVLAGTLIKVPYAVERPGPITDTLGTLDDGSSLVQVKGAKSYPTDGALYFTTVRVLGGPERHINGWEWALGHLDSDSVVVPEEEIFPKDTSEAEIEKINEAQMQGSQKDSIAVGMRSTGAKVPQVNLVASIAKGLPAAGAFELKDEIVSVDGKSYPGLGVEDRLERFREDIGSHECAGKQVDGCIAATPVAGSTTARPATRSTSSSAGAARCAR